jgi:aryl-alcohol dehydrogenase-like predicted oxidoreductase
VPEVALAYILAKPFVMSVIIGARRLDQLEENLKAVKLKLDPDDMAKLDEVSALKPEYPAWMIERHAAGRPPAPFAEKN